MIGRKRQSLAKPGIEVGDQIYFECKTGPRAGRVCSKGKHGCVIDCDGERHNVRWGSILGHKQRSAQRFTILDEGEDGVIVEDASGQRRYLSIPPNTGGDEDDFQMSKSFNLGGRVVMLLKAGKGSVPYAGRPGLRKEPITDKLGRRSSRWKSVGQDAPQEQRRAAQNGTSGNSMQRPAQQPHEAAGRFNAGDKVHFTAGDFSGTGEVIGTPGADGAYVKDSSGRVHQVRYDEISPQPGEKERGSSKPFFEENDIAHLPASKDYRHDAFSSWEEAIKVAPETREQFHSILKGIASTMGIEEVTGNPDEMSDEMIDSDKTYMFMGPIKKQDKSTNKVNTDYNGDWGQLKDLVRATIAAKGVEDVRKVLAGLREAGIEIPMRPKDNMTKATKDGYRDINMILLAPNGVPVELQIHVKEITRVKSQMHDYYNKNITLKRENGNKDISEWNEEDRAEFMKNRAIQNDVYGRAWSKVPGAGVTMIADDAEQQQQSLQKSLVSNMIMFLKERKNENRRE